MRYVFPTAGLKRYRFPTHINDLVMDRAEAQCSEVFVVVVEPGKGAPPHQHDDTEQVFYVLEGEGTLLVGPAQEPHAVRPGDVVRIPPSVRHTIRAKGPGDLRYLAIDCFGALGHPGEPTWDSHVRVLCRRQGWKYDEVVNEDGGTP
jgi:quercetin dioxygenase-like cupin family protein